MKQNEQEPHPHAEMIKAKVDNMELVMFVKGDAWNELNNEIINLKTDKKYFICLPQHKEACLHWLNGGEIEVMTSPNNWLKADRYSERASIDWALTDGFMYEELCFRLKPKKEKRWVAIELKNKRTTRPFPSEKLCREHVKLDWLSEWQVIEIEVEV